MIPIHQIIRAVRDGSVILTANQRLSRTLRKAYDDHQLAQGRPAWESPVILPFGSWLRAQWSDALLAGGVPASTLLNRAQEQMLWREAITATPEGASLLDLRGTVTSAMGAWRLIHQYRLPLDGRFAAHEDWAAFAEWAAWFRDSCRTGNFLDEARLPDAVLEAAGAIAWPASLLLAGFDEFTPQQRDVLAACERGGCSYAMLDTGDVPAATVRRGACDADDELRSAAEWARDLLRTGEKGPLGIVLLNIGVRRSRLERVFDEALHPERMRDPAAGGRRDFHISIPDPLAGYPLVDSALLALRMAGEDRWALADAGLLLRLPFIGGGIDEAPARSVLDAKLRRRRRMYVSAQAVASLAAGCPRLSGILERWSALAPSLRTSRLPSAWIAVIREILEAAGWPGDRVVSSAEYQVLESWNALLAELASLDAVAQPVTFGEVVARLGELAEDTQFQPQDPGAAVQIMGALEAAGARFGALWICGATDDTWPAPAHAHPFLPLSLQRDHKLPHSSAEREYEFAARTFARLQTSTPELVVSWPQRAGDVALRSSPLIEGTPDAGWAERAVIPREPFPLERLIDETGPPLETTQPYGGTRLLKLQAACPFQAFAALRLGASPLANAEAGLSALDRGNAIHEALQLFWEAIRDYATLTAMSDDDLHEKAAAAVSPALHRTFRNARETFDLRFRELEQERLTGVLVEWANLEKQRAPFTVAFNERERTIPIAGLELSARIDRVDQLPDGRQVILDYKATAPQLSAWCGARPDEPQLPLYAISNEAPVAAVAFAQVGPDGLLFRGYATSAGILPGTKAFTDTADQQIEEWRRVMTPVAEAFRQGAAAVDPKKGHATCSQCGLMALCRIYESGPVPEEDTDAAA